MSATPIRTNATSVIFGRTASVAPPARNKIIPAKIAITPTLCSGRLLRRAHSLTTTNGVPSSIMSPSNALHHCFCNSDFHFQFLTLNFLLPFFLCVPYGDLPLAISADRHKCHPDRRHSAFCCAVVEGSQQHHS